MTCIWNYNDSYIPQKNQNKVNKNNSHNNKSKNKNQRYLKISNNKFKKNKKQILKQNIRNSCKCLKII